MALWVEDATERIIFAAKEEFIEKGFLDASLRKIAEMANTSPRSIYTRFSNKEDLFSYFVKEHKKYFLGKIQEHLESFSKQEKRVQIKSRIKDKSEFIKHLIDYIYKYFDEFYLLICCSKGTEFEKFIEELALLETDHTKKYLKAIDEEISDFPKVTDDFIHMVSNSFFNGFFEIVKHKFTKEKAIDHIEKLIIFYNGGWEKFLK